MQVLSHKEFCSYFNQRVICWKGFCCKMSTKRHAHTGRYHQRGEDPMSRSPFLHNLYKMRYIFHKRSRYTSRSPPGWDMVAPLWHKERWLTDKSSIQIKAMSEPEGKGHSVQKEDWIEYIPKCILVKSLDGGHLRENNKSFWSAQLKGTPLLEAIMPLV